MAVKHLQNVQRQQLAVAIASDPTVLRKFKSGFNECAGEINKFVSQMEGVDESLRQRINSHLTKCMNGIEQVVQISVPGFPFLSGGSIFSNIDSDDMNNNPRIQISQGLQLIPSRLPTGELALLLPNSTNLPLFPSQQGSSTHRQSAFVSVVPSTSTLKSPTMSPSTNSQNDDVILVSHTYQNSPSPKAFRPVHKSAFTAPSTSLDTLHQVPQITSTQQEVKTFKYPIHHGDKDKAKKLVEPLCVITNHAERYKQAQVREDAANYEENMPFGMKRPLPDQGLLTVASQDFLFPPSKRFQSLQSSESEKFKVNEARSEAFKKPQVSETQSGSCNSSASDRRQDEGAEVKGNQSAEQSDMWRPW